MSSPSEFGPAHPPSPEFRHRFMERMTRERGLGRGPTKRGIGRDMPWKGPSLGGGTLPSRLGREKRAPEVHKKAKPIKGSPVAARRKRARLAARGLPEVDAVSGRLHDYPATRQRSRRHRMRAGRLAS